MMKLLVQRSVDSDEKFKSLELQLAQIAVSNQTREQGKLPACGQQPGHSINAISLRSGTRYEGPSMPEDEEPEKAEISENRGLTDRSESQPIGRDEEFDGFLDGLRSTDRSRFSTDRLVSAREKQKNSTDRSILQPVGQSSKTAEIADSAKKKGAEQQAEIKLPFPNRQKNAKTEKQFSKFMEVVKNLEVTVPFTELITQIPAYTRFMKDILTRKRTTLEVETIALAQDSSSVLRGKLPTKLGDPGSYSITCSIGSLVIDSALCDLGASVSIMPTSVWERLKIGELKPYGGRIQLADRTLRFPRGIVEDVPVKVGKFYIPVDFLVMDIAEDVHIPIILGRPFLNTAGAVIDVKNGNLTLEVGDDKIKFNLSQVMKHPMIEESVSLIDVIDETVNEVWTDSQLRDPCDALMSSVSCADNSEDNPSTSKALEVVLNCEGLSDAQKDDIEEIMRPASGVGVKKTNPEKGKSKANKIVDRLKVAREELEWRIKRDRRKLRVGSLNAAVSRLNYMCPQEDEFDGFSTLDPGLKSIDGFEYWDPGEDF